MFTVEWLHGVIPVQRDLPLRGELAQVIEAARLRADAVKAIHLDSQPDGFEISDDTGSFLAIYPI